MEDSSIVYKLLPISSLWDVKHTFIVLLLPWKCTFSLSSRGWFSSFSQTLTLYFLLHKYWWFFKLYPSAQLMTLVWKWRSLSAGNRCKQFMGVLQQEGQPRRRESPATTGIQSCRNMYSPGRPPWEKKSGHLQTQKKPHSFCVYWWFKMKKESG